MSTFNSIEGSRQLQVKSLHECFTLVIEYKDAGRSGLTLAPSDAPALALAILEAAGYSEDDRKESNSLYATEFASAMIKLAEGIEAQERITAEAKEQAELEAEAHDFYETYHSAADWPYQDWVMLEERYKAQFLAVARKAREMRAEK